jgi:hypothetical protein
MEIIAIAAVTLLIIMGLFHIYWAFGGTIGLDKALPTKDGVRLFNPGRVLTFIVGTVLFGFSFVAYSLCFDAANADATVYTGWVLSALFVIRAVGEFNAVGFFKKIRSTEFAAYDTKYFSPLCLFLGVVFALLSAQS